jgi:ankyrin repeat protein
MRVMAINQKLFFYSIYLTACFHSSAFAQKGPICSIPWELSQLREVEKKQGGTAEGKIYRDASDVTWIAKEGQNPAYEYIGAKLFHSIYGNQSPLVKLIREPTQNLTASRFIVGFAQWNESEIGSLYDIPGAADLKVGMDFIALGDRHSGNLGTIETRNGLIAARVDFDHSFEFGEDDPATDVIGMLQIDADSISPSALGSAIERLIQVPDDHIERVVQAACQELVLTYQSPKCQTDPLLAKLASTLKKRKAALPRYLRILRRWQTRINTFVNNPNPTQTDLLNLQTELSFAFGHQSLLSTALASQHHVFTQKLMTLDIDVNEKKPLGSYPVEIALAKKQYGLAETLFKRGANVNALDDDDCPLLIGAINRGQLDAAIWLMEHQADLHAPDKYGNTPLSAALLERSNPNWTIAKSLITHGADVNAAIYSGETLLHLAATNDNLALATWLIEHKANVNAIDQYKNTPLMTALLAATPKWAIAELLTTKGAEVNVKTRSGTTLISQAFTRRKINTVTWLVKHHADLNIPNSQGTALLYEVLFSQPTTDFVLAELLFNHGADVNARGKRAVNLLSEAMLLGRVDVANWLREHNALTTHSPT